MLHVNFQALRSNRIWSNAPRHKMYKYRLDLTNTVRQETTHSRHCGLSRVRLKRGGKQAAGLRRIGSESYFSYIYQTLVATCFVQPRANSRRQGSLRVSRIVSLDRALYSFDTALEVLPLFCFALTLGHAEKKIDLFRRGGGSLVH